MYNQLTSEQRYYIEVSLQNNVNKKVIAEHLNVHISTVYREIKRNSGKYRYHYQLAQKKCDEHKHRMRGIRTFTIDMRKRIFSLLVQEQWSPEQIKGYMEQNGERCACIETIYSYIRFDRKNGGTLWKHCRHRLKHVHRQVTRKYNAIKDRKMIDFRPKEANRKRFGDWEMDCIVGPENKGAILTLVERSTSFMMMRKLSKGKNAKQLARTVVSMLLPYKQNVLTITTDNGTEFADFKFIEERLNTNIFFTHPYSSWEKGHIENTNGLVRQYITKKMAIKDIHDETIKQIQYKLNRRPRKTQFLYTCKRVLQIILLNLQSVAFVVGLYIKFLLSSF